MNILLFVPTLRYGGAETQFINLSKGLYKRGHSVTVAMFYSLGWLQNELKREGVSVVSLEKRGRWDVFGFLWRLVKLLCQIRPDAIYGFGVPNIITAILKPFFDDIKMIWGIRYSEIELHHYDYLSRFTYRIQRWLSPLPDLIIVNSYAGLEYARKCSFPTEKLLVIPNGIDTERFFINPTGHKKVRGEWGIGEDQRLIGIVGRLDPIKDHQTFLKAASIVAEESKDIKFVIIGDGPPDYIKSLKLLSEKLGLGKYLIWAGYRQDMTAVYNSLDIIVSSSLSEGFSNVICEAMSCGVYPVVTDVGDSKIIVYLLGVVVKAGDSEKLANGLQSAMIEIQKVNRNEIRRRIENHFNLEQMVEKTERALLDICRSDDV